MRQDTEQTTNNNSSDAATAGTIEFFVPVDYAVSYEDSSLPADPFSSLSHVVDFYLSYHIIERVEERRDSGQTSVFKGTNSFILTNHETEMDLPTVVVVANHRSV